MNTGENRDASTRTPLLHTVADVGLWTELRDKPHDKETRPSWSRAVPLRMEPPYGRPEHASWANPDALAGHSHARGPTLVSPPAPSPRLQIFSRWGPPL